MSLPTRLLREEVRLAVQSLNWPPLIARGWEPLAAGEETGNGVRGVGARVGADAASAGGGAESGGGGGFRKGVSTRLRVMSWNVLCDGLSGKHPERGGFFMAPEGSLDWEKRRYVTSRGWIGLFLREWRHAEMACWHPCRLYRAKMCGHGLDIVNAIQAFLGFELN